ncbi:Flp family type IVb pilin [Mesorhizobium sp. 1B3]|uniref:Flp family type IVb pilin n=1 Tax=Mesorhizobium sp. 1B3 TaxID=3243599 RepID=UPI003D962773
MFDLLKKFKNDESGATAIEYGLIAALIAIAVIGGAQYVGKETSQKFVDIGDKLKEAKPTPVTPE